MDLYKYEKELKEQGYINIGGCDEAGRGPLYGPVVAACCVLPEGFSLPGLNDSKQLSPKKREVFYDYLLKNTIYGVGIVDEKEIDRINIYEASRKAMMLAIKEVRTKTTVDYVLTDAMPLFIDLPYLSIIKGDAKSASIAAASVIAKVTRDHMMIEIDKKYPQYGFARHKGYPTKAHIAALHKYGLIPGYRLTYGPVKELINENR